MKIAIIQTNPQSDFNENLQKCLGQLRKAALQNVDLILLPETFLFMGIEEERKKFHMLLLNNGNRF